jgi:hypothetical protein
MEVATGSADPGARSAGWSCSCAIGRGWPQLRLGLRQFCRHACTSWHFSIGCIALLDSVVFLPHAEIGAELSVCLPPVQLWTGNTCGRWSCHLRYRSNCLAARFVAELRMQSAIIPKKELLPCRLLRITTQELPPVAIISGSMRCDRCFPQVMPFLTGAFAAYSLIRNERCGKASLLGGELALPVWGGSRQPLDRQL